MGLLPAGIAKGYLIATFREIFHRCEPVRLHQMLETCSNLYASDPNDTIFTLQQTTEEASHKLLWIDLTQRFVRFF